MASKTYCNEPANQGLTCLKKNLTLLRKLSEDHGSTYTNIIFLYECRVCQGLYKYINASTYQTRNFDAEEGWTIYNDYYFKVGEANGAGSVQFPLTEARIYGYTDNTET